jgi:hypothetical protein
MAFTSVVSGQTVFGNLRVTYGTFDGSGVTTGDIDTGLGTVFTMAVNAGGSSVVADSVTINETFPLAGSAITIIFTSGKAGTWIAFGK